MADVGHALPVPEEVSGQTSLQRSFALSEPLRDVTFGVGALASALGRAVVAPFALELLLVGFVAPALARWRGSVVALVVVAVLFAAAGSVVGDTGALTVPGLALGAASVWLYFASGSLLGPIALACATAGAALGVAFGWTLGAVALAVGLGP